MGFTEKYPSLTQPATYQIRIQGTPDAEWTDWLDELAISVEGDTTTLTGIVADQVALHGLLVKIRDLGVPLLSVNLVRKALGPLEIRIQWE